MNITERTSHINRSAVYGIAIWIACLIAGIGNAQTEFKNTSSMFDGKTLNGWKLVNPKDSSLWSVEQGAITCHNRGKLIPSNSFLQSTKAYQNFEFRCLFRLSGDSGFINSGIQYRSNVKKNGEVVGYQADIGSGYWGDLYDENRRGTLVKGDSTILPQLLFDEGWNSYIIRVKDNFHELYINGIKTVEYKEADAAIPSRGIIALQIHGGGIARVEFKDIFITTY